MKLKGLAQGDIKRIKNTFGQYEVEWSDEWPPEAGSFDLIVLDHFIQTANRRDIFGLIKFYADLLKEGGEMFIIVPSLEWAAQEIVTQDEPGLAVYMSLYGTDEEQYLSGFTLRWLRTLVDTTENLVVTLAINEPYMIKYDERSEKVYQNKIGCIRRTENPAEAIQ